MKNTEALPFISIIVPVYNVKDYLEKCLQSICVQTYKNLEIILIDDGSSDGSGELCDLFAQRDGRIKVIHQTNAGQSAAGYVRILVSLTESEWGGYIHLLALYRNCRKDQSEALFWAILQLFS